MSDEQERPGQTEEAGDEVEGHRHGHKMAANAEATDEMDAGDDEVEAHRHGHKMV